MSSFAEHLVERGVVSREQIERARETRHLYGGRLGTNLVETGALETSELAARLSEFLGVPPPPVSWLGERSREAEQALPLELVERHKVVPLRIEGRTLHVATLDPRDPELREVLTQAADLDVELWVLPELRLYSLLGKRYGIRRERKVSLAQLAEEARKRREARAPATVRDEPDPEERERRALGIAPLDEGEELVGETFFSDLHARLPTTGSGTDDGSLSPLDDSLIEPADPPPATTPLAIEPAQRPTDQPAHGPLRTSPHPHALEAALRWAADRDTLVDALLALACLHGASSLLLVLDDGMLALEGMRHGGAPRRVEALRLPCRGESNVTRAMAGLEPYRGVAATAIDERVLDALGAPGGSLAALPIMLGDLPVALLCVGDPHPIADTSFAALCTLAGLAGASWERITFGLDP